MPLEVRQRAAQRLIRFSGLDFNSVFFVNSGAEANENALKMAFAITQRAARGRRAALLPWPHCRHRRADLGRGRQVVRLSAHTL